MKKMMFAMLALVAACVQAVTKFDVAESVWPAGLEQEMNTLIAFKAAFDLNAGEKPVLKLVAWYSYRVKLNGTFVAFGPARGPKGFFRPDELDLAKAAKPGRNDLVVEVAGYNVPNFYLMEQSPFFKAEVVVDGKVRTASRATGSDFSAIRLPRVQKVPRYTFQRTFAEVYRLPAAANPPALPLAKAPEPVLIERRAPYPDYEENPRMVPVSFAKIRYDEKAKVHKDRSLTLPGKSKSFKGFPIAELEINSSFLAQRLVSFDRRVATEAEKSATIFPLAAGQSIVFDNGLNDSGFPGLRVEVKKPGRLVLQFDEVLADNGEARGVQRYRDCCNVIVWDFTQPGVYEVDAFEPYTMRYVELDAVSGEMSVSAPRFRSYKNATAKRASFRASDPALVQIFNAASETFRQNAVDVFMDCPSRERAGWNCDAYFTGPVSTMLTGDAALERIFEENHALPPKFDDIGDGMLPMCYPSDHRDGVFIPNWAMWFTLETGEYLQRTGDRATVDALRPRLEKLVKFLQTFRNKDGLLEKLPSWVFVEWSRSNKLVQDVNYPSNMTWADVLETMDRLYGRPDLAAEAKRVRAEVLRQSWTGQWFCDNAVRQKDGTLKLSGECTETCQYYAFFHKVATPQSHPALWKTLLTDFGPQRYDPVNRCKLLKYPEIWPSNAFIGNYLRLKLLERAGLGQQILRETKGYFKYMADRTGTLWENDTTCASCNHGFASYAAVLLVHSVLGVEVDHVQRTVTVRRPDVDLDFCGVTLPVPGGEIVYDWKRKDDSFVDSFKAPMGWRLVRAGETSAVPLEKALARAMLPKGNRIVYDNAVKAVYEADLAADAAWTACATPEALKVRQAKVRKDVLAALGGFPERCPLNVVVTGREQRDGYSVEKLYFESQPKHYVTANLFLPDAAKYPGKRPGIVVPCGHSTNGKGSCGYQRGALQAAKAGMVAMVYDPIDQGERRQSRQSAALWNCSAHNNVGRRAELLGWNTARFRTWDGIRALDVLAARSEVDAAKLGVMGHSGGGTMTSWIMALDDRVACAAPSGFLSTMRAVCEQCGPQDAEQFVFGELAIGFNHLGHIVLRAPSPVLHCSSHGDFFPFSGVLETSVRAQGVYNMLGASTAYSLSDTLGPHHWHESTRTRAVAWMDQWLQDGKGVGAMQDHRNLQYGFDYAKVDVGLGYEPKNLDHMRTNGWAATVTPTGSTLDLPGSRTVYDLMKDEAERAKKARPKLSVETVRDVARIGEADFKVCNSSFENGVDWATLVRGDGTPIPVATIGKGLPVLLVSDATTRAALAKTVAKLVAAGKRVTVADIRGFGETSKLVHAFYGVKEADEELAQLAGLVGVSFVGKRAEDVLAAAKYAGAGYPVELIAQGRAAVAAAHARFVGGKELFSGFTVENAPASWGELFENDAQPYRFADVVNNAWRYYDWTDLCR